MTIFFQIQIQIQIQKSDFQNLEIFLSLECEFFQLFCVFYFVFFFLILRNELNVINFIHVFVIRFHMALKKTVFSKR